MKRYDYLIVGAGLFGATFAYEMTKRGKKCLVIDRRNHIGGNIYCEKINDINVHKYGAHIFHTSDKEVWDYVNNFVEFNNYVNSPIADYKGEIYNLPFNMNTFSKLWGISKPSEAMEIIEKQKKELGDKESENLEEQAISLVGRDIYEKLIKVVPKLTNDNNSKSKIVIYYDKGIKGLNNNEFIRFWSIVFIKLILYLFK